MQTARHERFDVAIIGSGAGGGPLAFTLSKNGFRVLVLEKGRRYCREEYVHDEMLATEQFGLFVPRVSEDPHVLVNNNGTSEITSLGWIASCVGGGTSHMGGSLYRLHPDDFHLRSLFGGDYGFVDWPYTYADLEPYYTAAEWAVGISGAAEENRFEGPRSRRYPLPPLPQSQLGQGFTEAAKRLGLQSFVTPKAIASRAYQGRAQCSGCSLCAGFGCPVGARGSTQETVLYWAEQTGNCEIRASAMVSEVSIAPNGNASGCLYFDEDGERHQVLADVVCVCCSAVESARLLLLSKSSEFPEGLANRTGLVGKNLQFERSSSARAPVERMSKVPCDAGFPFFSCSLMDFYFLPPGAADIPKGGTLKFEPVRAGPIALAQQRARDSGRVIWGDELVARLRNCMLQPPDVELEIFHDFLPDPRTYVDLDPDIKDKWGLPAARLHLAPSEFAMKAGKWLVDRGLEIFAAAGMRPASDVMIGGLNRSLIHGSCRAGRDSRYSVLNGFCQSHEVPNLFVVDGSFMPTSGGVPSTLTILANSFRVADYIVGRSKFL